MQRAKASTIPSGDKEIQEISSLVQHGGLVSKAENLSVKKISKKSEEAAAEWICSKAFYESLQY